MSWRRAGYLLAERLRLEDLCIRWTDGSAVVVLEHTTEAQAGLVAKRLRGVDEAAAFGIGVAERRAGEGVQHLVGRAGDAASKELVDIQTRQRLASSMHFS